VEKSELDQMIREAAMVWRTKRNSERHRIPRVRWAMAANPECPPEMLDLLADDPCPQVRQQVAMNPNCPAAVAASLLLDDYPLVRAAARRYFTRRQETN